MNKTKKHPLSGLLTKTKIKSLKKGEEIEAKIVSISKKTVVFDIGGKSKAILGREETLKFSFYFSNLKPGDKVLVRVITPESKEGYPVVSIRNFFQKSRWQILQEKKEKEEEIEVLCGEYGHGGVFIDFMGVRGVIPKIQLFGEVSTNPEGLKGKKIKVKVLEVDEKKNRLVVSQKAAVLKISQKEIKERFEKIEEGKTYAARVLSISDFGIFCEVDGVEGLVHLSEVSWEKISNTKTIAKTGDKISVLVIKKNPKDLKLNLSIKRLTKDPWSDIEKRYPKEKGLTGKIVRKEKYGYIVRFEPGVEGLIHISNLKKEQQFNVGQKVNVYIEKINKKNRRISLILPEKEKPVTYR